MLSCLVVKGKGWTHVVGCQFSLALVRGPQVFPANVRIPTSPWADARKDLGCVCFVFGVRQEVSCCLLFSLLMHALKVTAFQFWYWVVPCFQGQKNDLKFWATVWEIVKWIYSSNSRSPRNLIIKQASLSERSKWIRLLLMCISGPLLTTNHVWD